MPQKECVGELVINLVNLGLHVGLFEQFKLLFLWNLLSKTDYEMIGTAFLVQ